MMVRNKVKKERGDQTARQEFRLNLRLGAPLKAWVDILVEKRAALDFSEYMRGLVIKDGIDAGMSPKGIPIPGWLTETLVSSKQKKE